MKKLINKVTKFLFGETTTNKGAEWVQRAEVNKWHEENEEYFRDEYISHAAQDDHQDF